jgi:hypothetical protein
MRTLSIVAICCSLSFFASAQCLEGDCQNGRGIFQFDTGNKYAGDFRKGYPHGKGAVYFINGNRYNGDWVMGVREGTGIFYFSAGNVYTGTFRKNRFNGQGTMTFTSGNKYTGNWENDQPNGSGVFYFAGGDRYEGAFRNGNFEGFGIMLYKNRERYEGSWANNVRHGKGKMYRSDGSIIEGTWENGSLKTTATEGGAIKPTTTASNNTNETLQDCNSIYCREGKGTYNYGDGSRWVGYFKDGVPEGQGTCYYANGDKFVGNFEKHAPHGEGIMYYKNGRILSALWEYGRPVGDMPANSRINDQKVDVESDPEVKIWAVVIGVGRYKSMPVLKYSDDDAYQFYAFLKSPEGGALPDKQVRILVDEDATRANILTTMRQVYLKADDNDVIVFYFSGHGLEGYFLPQDFDGTNNKLYHNEIKTLFEQSRAKHKVCIADACHSGSLLAMKNAELTSTLRSFYRAFNETKGGMALFMSSKGEEYSLEDQGLRSGIFSHYLIRGLKGEADIDANNIVTIREVFDYVYKNVRVYTSNAQTPTISGNYDAAMPISVIRH